MNENELLNVTNQTPIEIALDIDSDGMTTAKKLYKFLELNPSQYSRWVRRNITDNPFATENEDYFYSTEMSSEQNRGRFAKDYKLTAHFAKKLSMKGDGEKAEQAREYFTRVEEKAKEIMEQKNIEMSEFVQSVAMIANSVSDMANVISKLSERIGRIENIESELRLESNKLHTCPTLTWYERNKDTIYYVAEQRGITGKKVISMVLSHIGEYYDLTKAKEIYYKQTGSKPLYDLDIIDYFSNLQKEATSYLNSFIRKKPVKYDDFDIVDMF